MAMVYACSEHPEKVYSSWRKFRGHWTVCHKGEVCPPREEFYREIDGEVGRRGEIIKDGVQITTGKVEEEAGIKIANVERVSESYYLARLTDDNVNKIQRAENQLLDFFNPRELKKLFLSKPTQEFISRHRSLIPTL